MPQLSELQLTDLVVEWVKRNSPKAAGNGFAIDANTDLIRSGLLDSFSFVDLIAYIETESGCQFDFTDVDASEFSVVRGLCRIALRGHTPS
jgi:acyl carrier protein